MYQTWPADVWLLLLMGGGGRAPLPPPDRDYEFGYMMSFDICYHPAVDTMVKTVILICREKHERRRLRPCIHFQDAAYDMWRSCVATKIENRLVNEVNTMRGKRL
jgi:hypothetical protein